VGDSERSSNRVYQKGARASIVQWRGGAFQSRGIFGKVNQNDLQEPQCTSHGLPWLILEAIWAVCPQVEMHPWRVLEKSPLRVESA
jgi:hypothetical protein